MDECRYNTPNRDDAAERHRYLTREPDHDYTLDQDDDAATNWPDSPQPYPPLFDLRRNAVIHGH